MRLGTIDHLIVPTLRVGTISVGTASVALLGFALAFDVDLDLPRRKAERRFCAVGNPAWMPG